MYRHYEVIFKLLFRLREKASTLVIARLRRAYWQLQGMLVGDRTVLPRLVVTWPHQVKIGKGCFLEPDIYFKFDGICKPGPNIIIGDNTFVGRGCEFNISEHISIGRDCLIASGVKFVDHNHGIDPDSCINLQRGASSAITIEDDVWIGANAIVLPGVHIKSGAVVAAGAVVRSNVASYDVVGGVPAKFLKNRRLGIEKR